jgi:hypothetical protein
MSTEEQEINKSAGEVIDVACIECKRATKHKVLASVETNGTEDCGGGNSIDYGGGRQIIQCQGCETMSFRIETWNSEDYDYNDETGKIEICPSVTLFPSRSEGRAVIRDSYLLPTNVQRIYGETIKAHNNDQPVLSGIGIRALVESICKDKQAPGRNLADKINGLVTQGVLTAAGASILHQIRTLGNDAAHEVKPHKAEQLALALDVCDHLMQGVYILPHYANKTFRPGRSAEPTIPPPPNVIS